jgi:tetratricopeptide (TPR) repeat protein
MVAGPPRRKHKTNPPQLKADAQREERSGRLLRAIELLEELLRETPDDWSSVQRLAQIRARNGDRRAAVGLYRRLADHYEEDEHLSRAIAVWRVVLRLDPSFLATHVRLGELYARQGFRVESRRHYATAIAGFRRRGQEHEVEQARRALDAVEGRSADESGPARPGASAAGPSALPGAMDPGAVASSDSPHPPAGSETDPPSLDEAEFVAERSVEAKMFRRYKLFGQARAALDALLQRVPTT